MRVFSFVFIIVSAVSVSAQTPFIQKTFDDATAAAQTGNYETALENYRRAEFFAESEKSGGDDFRAKIHFNIGVCLYRLRQNAEAVEEFTEAIKLSKRTYQKAFYALGMAQAELKNRRESERAFREAVRLKKSDGEAWFDLGLVLLTEKDYAAAEQAFHQAIEFKSANATDAHNNLGVIYALKGDFPQAETEFRTALRQSGGASVEAANNLRFCRLYKQNFNLNLAAKLEFSRRNKTGE